jgi:hypothetical protein
VIKGLMSRNATLPVTVRINSDARERSAADRKATNCSGFQRKADCHLRTGPTQCELSQQEVLTQPLALTGNRAEARKDWGGTSVSATARQAQDERGQAERLGIKPGQVVQELGYDTDTDEQLRQAITAVDGVELVDEDYEDVVDVVLMWWREEDGDLVDALVDALTPLADGGYIWLLTPKAGRPGHVEPSDIGEAAPTAGLAQTSSVSAARDWSGSRLVAPKARR